MEIDNELKEKLSAELKAFKEYAKVAAQETGHKLGESCAPDADLTGQCEVPPAAAEYYGKVAEKSAKIDELIIQGIRQIEDKADLALKVPRSKAWVWGGPTPFWFGSLADDTLIKGAEYFNVPNVVYVGGPVEEKYIAPLAKFDKVMVQMTDTCRAKEFQPESDEECAAKASAFSAKYPNIISGMLDDATHTGHNKELKLDGEVFRKVQESAKKHNPAMQVSCVIYMHELDQYDFTPMLPYIDRVVLWFWSKQDLLRLEERFERCCQVFAGKEILLGIFIHDYGCADLGNPPECLKFQMHKAARLIKDGKLNGIVILGDREIRKWPASAQAVKDCLE
ncbi:MAG: hypothetical protein IJS08_05035 [Victivallales bacterium]|nr:hypothetical protein [Victivallales bacterium]